MLRDRLDKIADHFWVPRLIINQGIEIITTTLNKTVHKKMSLCQTSLKEQRLYPRPQMKRDSFFSLDGEWEFAPLRNKNYPINFNKKIKVPYPPQSDKSGLSGTDIGTEFWYRKIFSLPKGFIKDLVILHFGAVDQVCQVYINRQLAGSHEGGYLPFSFNITNYLNENDNEIAVYVKDDLNKKYPYGKQTNVPGGMWYTPVSGIWQSVWIESVPKTYVKSFVCRYDGHEIEMDINGTGTEYEVTVFEPVINKKSTDILKVYHLPNGKSKIHIDNPKLWSPEKPYLYQAVIKTGNDEVRVYFALRTVQIEIINGKQRICINHKPYFFHGVLDQGYFCDGIYTPVSDKCYEQDIMYMKSLGFNTLRKHIKIEPERFYYDCDRLGMVVFQDMVNNGDYSWLINTCLPRFWGQSFSDKYTRVSGDVRLFFEKHCRDTIRYLENHPSIIYYTVFNEGWGQYDSRRIVDDLKRIDPSRIYDGASGWYKQEDGTDVESEHFYFHMIKPKPTWSKPVIISECGGFTRIIPGHSMYSNGIYGYGKSKSERSLTDRIYRMYINEVLPNIKNGICGCIYTQLSDVEEEANGLYTYDRAKCKVNKGKMLLLGSRLHGEFNAVTKQL